MKELLTGDHFRSLQSFPRRRRPFSCMKTAKTQLVESSEEIRRPQTNMGWKKDRGTAGEIKFKTLFINCEMSTSTQRTSPNTNVVVAKLKEEPKPQTTLYVK